MAELAQRQGFAHSFGGVKASGLGREGGQQSPRLLHGDQHRAGRIGDTHVLGSEPSTMIVDRPTQTSFVPPMPN